MSVRPEWFSELEQNIQQEEMRKAKMNRIHDQLISIESLLPREKVADFLIDYVRQNVDPIESEENPFVYATNTLSKKLKFKRKNEEPEKLMYQQIFPPSSQQVFSKEKYTSDFGTWIVSILKIQLRGWIPYQYYYVYKSFEFSIGNWHKVCIILRSDLIA